MKKLLKNLKQNERGFTLIELIVVIAIIGILAIALLPKFSGFTDSAKKKTALTEAKTIYTAYSAVEAENGKVAEADIKAYVGKLPKGADGTADITGYVTPSGDPIIQYTTNVSGKKFDVKIKAGGDIDITASK